MKKCLYIIGNNSINVYHSLCPPRPPPPTTTIVMCAITSANVAGNDVGVFTTFHNWYFIWTSWSSWKLLPIFGAIFLVLPLGNIIICVNICGNSPIIITLLWEPLSPAVTLCLWLPFIIVRGLVGLVRWPLTPFGYSVHFTWRWQIHMLLIILS